MGLPKFKTDNPSK